MNIIKRITAFFRYRGEDIELPLKSAVIRNGVAYLKSEDKPETTVAVEAESIAIYLDGIADDAVTIIEPSDKDHSNTDNTDSQADQPLIPDTDSEVAPGKPGNRKTRKAAASDFAGYARKSFSTKLYPTEREEIKNACRELGFARDETVLAAVRVASPRKVAAEVKRIRKERERYTAPENDALLDGES